MGVDLSCPMHLENVYQLASCWLENHCGQDKAHAPFWPNDFKSFQRTQRAAAVNPARYNYNYYNRPHTGRFGMI